MLQKKILFITTSNLATNPRLVKEIDLAVEQNYSVVVLLFSFSNWSSPLNEKLKVQYTSKVTLIEIPAERRPLIPWLYSAVAERLCSFLLSFGLKNSFILSQSLQKRTVLLMGSLSRLSFKPDLVVAHNPGSFYPAMVFAKKRNVPFATDIEDYHPGEYSDNRDSKRMKKLMQAVLPKAVYISAAAPLILEEVERDNKGLLNKRLIVPNYFPSSEFIPPGTVINDSLTLVWFSQYVSGGRGLETLLEVIPSFKGRVELHLYGQPDEEFIKNTVSEVSSVYLHGSVLQQDLHKQLSSYDVGLAFEDARSNYNRDICLTNKLLSYFQAGLFVLATNTRAQRLFIKDNSSHGLVFNLTKTELINVLEQLLAKKVQIRKEKMSRYQQAGAYNSQAALKPLAQIWQADI